MDGIQNLSLCRQAECGDHGQEDVVLHPREEPTSEQQSQHCPQPEVQVFVTHSAISRCHVLS